VNQNRNIKVIVYFSRRVPNSYHHPLHSKGSMLALAGVLGQQRCEQSP